MPTVPPPPATETQGPVVAPNQVLDTVVRVYIGAVVLVGLILSVYAVLTFPPDPFAVPLFCVAAALAERLRVSISEETPVSISLSLAVILAAVVALGPGGAVLTAIAARIAVGVLSRPRPELRKTMFNLGLFAIQAATAALVYHALGGKLGQGLPSLREVGAALVALTAALLVNWALLLAVVHLSTGRSLGSIWREDLRWMLVQSAVSGLIGFTLGTAYALYGWLGMAVYVVPLAALRESMRMYTSRVKTQIDELREAHAESDSANRLLSATNDGLLKTLGAVIDARDIYLYGHSVQASKYAVDVARKLNLPADEVRTTELGALLHDLGKIGVSESILNKPARLTGDEYSRVKAHCDIGYDLLSNLPGFEAVADVVRSHHERYDGKGYPRGLRGRQIPIGARVVSVVEAVEAMVSDRPYRKALTAEQVLQELADGAGTQWDPDVVEAFSGILSQDHKHLSMRNSALEVALARSPLSELVSGASSDSTLRGVTETFRSSAQPIFILDEQLQIVSVNLAAERITGWTEAQLEGRGWIELTEPNEQRHSPGGAHFGTARHVSMKRPDAEIVELEVTGTAMRTNSAEYWLVLAHDVTRHIQVASDLRRRVSTDFLTQLATREQLELSLTDVMARQVSHFCVAILDLDSLKSINDSFGHLAGDAAIQLLAGVISAELREGDVGARIGGDEFALLMPWVTWQNALNVVQRIETSLAAEGAKFEYEVRFSYGVAEWNGNETHTELLHRADDALYSRKRDIPGRVVPLRITGERKL